MKVSLVAVCLLASVGLAEAATNPAAANLCVAPNNGQGTANMPAIECEYRSPAAQARYHRLKNVYTGADLLRLKTQHRGFTDITTHSGGTLDGEVENFNSHAQIEVVGVGPLEGFHRVLTVALAVETHTAPRTLGDPVQAFATQMYRLEGAIAGDEDFELLEITAGEDFGLPSPGHTTLTYQEDTDSYVVDSFFDVNY
ncbi:MAG: hypothetical protein GY856_21290, partial [bacterium]|nr:hypothetical protein [bacterium]